MVPWDSDKSTAADPDNPAADEQLTADEWDAHVADQKGHSARHENGGTDEIDVTGLSGDLADAQDPKQEAVEDFVGALIAGGTNVTATYDDGAGTLTIDTSALNEEEVEDTVAALIGTSGVVTFNYDDVNDAITLGSDLTAVASNITPDADGARDLGASGAAWANIHGDSVTTEQADITGETFVRATRGSTTSTITANNYVNVFDGESKDARGEFNASAQFTPDESGEYFIIVGLEMRGSTTKGDIFDVRILNTTDSSNVDLRPQTVTGANAEPSTAFAIELDAGVAYEVQARNRDSDFVIQSGQLTYGVIRRSIVHA